MKIGIAGTDVLQQGKANLVDERVKTLKAMFSSPKEVFIQVEIITENAKLLEADCIIATEGAKLDLVVADMEFIETRLARAADAAEKALLSRFKEQLDAEGLLCDVPLNDQEKALAAGYSLLTLRPVLVASPQDLQDKNKLLLAAYGRAGYISFFTAGDKDAHAWSIRQGTNAYEAAGAIHSAIQQGFIRAEVVNYKELVADGGLSKARANNRVRLETKEYVVQDGDYLVIRTNK